MKIPKPLCLHGRIWNDCPLCARTAWCEDCGDRLVLDEPLHPSETVTCEACIDRLIIGRVPAA